MRPYSRAFLWLALACLSACGRLGDKEEDGTQAERAHVAVLAQAPGVTPFIRTLVLGMQEYQGLASVSYTIAAKAGTRSAPVVVTYDKAWLTRTKAYDDAAKRLTLPVFGLYANYRNAVTLSAVFSDGSRHAEQVQVDTLAYTGAGAFYGTPAVRSTRTAAALQDLDFIEIHNGMTTPVVVDSDGNLRWVAAGLNNSISTLFDGSGFFVGDATAPLLYRLELDGALATIPLSNSTLTNFHHDLYYGKVGLLAEMDALADGISKLESVLAELSPTGQVLRQWDLAQIIGDHMRAQGDDPSNFVRDGFDWFHMNSAIYSKADDALYISSRENFVIKLDYESGRIKWLLGDKTKHWYANHPSLRALALHVSGGNPPIGQHALSLDAQGRLLLFNNGTPSVNQPPGAPVGATIPYSAAVKYAIDETARTAKVVWTYEHNRSLVSDICSSVYEGGSSSSVLVYSAIDARTRARLIALDQAGNVAFDYEYPTTDCATAFLARPIPFGALTLK